jgi:3-oxoacyl-[acyl-carrier-protein] synthase-1
MDRSEFFYKDEVTKCNSGRLRDVVLHDCGDSSETVARFLGISDFVTTISTACSSSANAVILADRLLRHNRLDAVLVGGIDPLCKFTVNGFSSLMILDRELCRPFDQSRAGLNLGEGAAFLVLQRKEDVESGGYCRLSGFANANDAYHQTAISHDGIGPFLAMEGALKSAGLHPSDIDYVNVHGTGTENNDWSEGFAMKRLFGDCVPMFSSTKVYTGHTLGACGAIEAVYSVLSLVNDMVFPTFNFKNAIEGLELEPVVALRENAGLKNVMSNSFGFGGNVSSLIFSKM